MTWKATIDFKNEKKEQIKKVCDDIANKDSDFKYEIKDNTLHVLHENRNNAFKKALWLVNKVDVLKGCVFIIKKRVDENEQLRKNASHQQYSQEVS